MATSPIYNWPEPDNTDLVKNGALAIRTMGNAIDTTMATMVPKSIVDAKGDLIAATANDTPARLAVGTNYNVLSAQSGETTGLQWAGATTSYTPTWTADGSAPSLGNGVLTGNYIRYGALCQVRMFFQAGSTTTFGTFGWNFSLPFTPIGGNYGVPGNAYIEDNAVAGYRAQTYINNQLYLQTTATNAKVGQATPFVWGLNDYINLQFIYEVA